MSFLPGWDSIETTSKLYKLFTGLALTCLGLVAVFDVLAWIYSNRKDSLIETVQQKREGQDQAKQSDLNARLSATEKAAREAKEQQVAAEKELAKLRANAEPRNLKGAKREHLIQDLVQHPGFVNYLTSVSDGEARSLARQIVEILSAAKWNIGTYAIESGATGQGIIYSIPDPQHPTGSERALIDAFERAGLHITVNRGNGDLIVGFRVPG